MTMPTGSDPNRPQVFDFGLGSTPSGSDPAQLTRRSSRRPTVDSRSLAVPITVALLILAAAGGSAFTAWYLVTTSEAEVKADSALFCQALAETPGVLSQPGFGWPTGGADLATTLGLMTDYRTRWQHIASVAPPTIKPDVAAVATAATTITENIETTKSIDRPTTLAQMEAVTSKTTIIAWSAKYC